MPHSGILTIMLTLCLIVFMPIFSQNNHAGLLNYMCFYEFHTVIIYMNTYRMHTDLE